MCIPFYLSRNYSRINIFEKMHAEKYWTMYEEFKLKSWMKMLYNFFFCIWWLLYALVIILLINWPLAQAIIFLLLTIPVLIYQLIYRPYWSFWANLFSNINEGVLILNGIGFFFFLTPDTKTLQNSIGWILIALIGITYIATIIFIWTVQIISLVKYIIKLCKQLWQKCKKPKND